MSVEKAIITNGLTKAYGSVQALRGVDLAVEKGTIFGFLGPNGAGLSEMVERPLSAVYFEVNSAGA